MMKNKRVFLVLLMALASAALTGYVFYLTSNNRGDQESLGIKSQEKLDNLALSFSETQEPVKAQPASRPNTPAPRPSPQPNNTQEQENSQFKLNLGYPNGGDKLEKSKSYDIKWEAGTGIEKIKIYLFDARSIEKEKPREIQLGEDSLPASAKTYAWKIEADSLPLPPEGKKMDNFKIRIEGYDREGNKKASDESDSVFEILPQIKLLNPNGGEKWQIGEKHSLEWEADPGIEKVKFLIADSRITSGDSEKEIVSDEEKVSATKGKYDWKIEEAEVPVPREGDKPNQFKLKIEGYDAENHLLVSDESDDYFTVKR